MYSIYDGTTCTWFRYQLIRVFWCKFILFWGEGGGSQTLWINSLHFSSFTDWIFWGTKGTIQQRSSSSIFFGRPAWAVLAWAGTATLGLFSRGGLFQATSPVHGSFQEGCFFFSGFYNVNDMGFFATLGLFGRGGLFQANSPVHGSFQEGCFSSGFYNVNDVLFFFVQREHSVPAARSVQETRSSPVLLRTLQMRRSWLACLTAWPFLPACLTGSSLLPSKIGDLSICVCLAPVCVSLCPSVCLTMCVCAGQVACSWCSCGL